MAGSAILLGVGNEVFLTLGCGFLLTLIVAAIAFKSMFNSGPQSTNADQADHQSYNNEVCPICISPQVLAVETNCGHKFCGSCLKSYLTMRTPESFLNLNLRPNCPLCRQDINLLLLSFTQEESQSAALEQERNNVQSTVNDYNVRFGAGPRSPSSYVRDCPVLIRHMLQEFFSFGGVFWMFRMRVILCFLAALFYLQSPLDCIPEAMFGVFGFFDDFIVFVLFAVYVSVIYRRLVISRGHAHEN